MEKFKFFIFSVVSLAVVGMLVYWAVISLESGSAHATKEKIQSLQDINEELENEVEDLKNELAMYQEKEKSVTEEAPKQEELEEEPTTYKYQSLINELQGLINDKVIMRVGSKGTRVGTIQNVLNLYFGTNKKVDNDYGKTTKVDVLNFQKKEGLPQTGETGSQTYQKMISWLKKQG